MIDNVDRKILNCLQEDGKMKLADVAKKVGKPTSTVFERIKKMEDTGIIKGYVAIVDPDKVGKNFVAYLLGQAQLGQNADLDEIGKILSKIPQVQEVAFITGEWDYILKIRVEDEKEYYDVVKTIARSLISRGNGMIVPKVFKNEVTFKL